MLWKNQFCPLLKILLCQFWTYLELNDPKPWTFKLDRVWPPWLCITKWPGEFHVRRREENLLLQLSLVAIVIFWVCRFYDNVCRILSYVHWSTVFYSFQSISNLLTPHNSGPFLSHASYRFVTRLCSCAALATKIQRTSCQILEINSAE